MNGRTVRGLCCYSLAIMVVSGCAEANEDVPTHSRQEIVAVLNSGLQEQQELGEAIDRIAKLCMEDKGFDVHPNQQPIMFFPAQSSNIEVALGVRYMFRSLQEVSEDGYGRPLESMQERMLRLDGEFLESSEDYRDDYSYEWEGDADPVPVTWPDGSQTVSYPVSGCQGLAYELVFGEGVQEYLYIQYYAADALTFESSQIMESSNEVVEATTKWAKCMETLGFEGYEDPLSALLSSGELYVGDNGQDLTDSESRLIAKEEEIQLATADYNCNLEASLDEVRAKVFWEESQSYFAEHETEIFQCQVERSRYSERAQELLSDPATLFE